MHKQEKWQAIIGPLVEAPFELVGVECVGGGKHTTVRVYVDKPGGITIDEIAKLSREISVLLDVETPLHGEYTLEVSSPGLDRPLFKPEHFKRQVGQKISVKAHFAMGKGNRHNFKGILSKVTEEGIQLDVEGELVSFAFEDIDKAKVIYSEAR